MRAPPEGPSRGVGRAQQHALRYCRDRCSQCGIRRAHLRLFGRPRTEPDTSERCTVRPIRPDPAHPPAAHPRTHARTITCTHTAYTHRHECARAGTPQRCSKARHRPAVYRTRPPTTRSLHPLGPTRMATPLAAQSVSYSTWLCVSATVTATATVLARPRGGLSGRCRQDHKKPRSISARTVLPPTVHLHSDARVPTHTVTRALRRARIHSSMHTAHFLRAAALHTSSRAH
jgi:hypothetical protein